MKTKLLIVILCICTLPKVNAQETPDETHTEPAVKNNTTEDNSYTTVIPSIGFIHQGDNYTEANVIIGIDGCTYHYLCGIIGWRVGAESNLKSGLEFVIAPKVGAAFTLFATTARISVVDYIQGSKSELRILPELGVTLFGLLDVTYGYGVRLTDTKIGGISEHRLGITANISWHIVDDLLHPYPTD